MATTALSEFTRSRFSWLAYFLLGYYAYQLAALGPMMPLLRVELGGDYTIGALHFSSLALGAIASGLTGDIIARRIGRTATFWLGSSVNAGTGLLLTLGHTPVLTIGACFAMGFFGTLLSQSVYASLADGHGDHRAIALSEANVFASGLTSLGPLAVAGCLRAGIGWRGAFYLGSVVFVAVALRFRNEPVPALAEHHLPGGASSQKLSAVFWAYWMVIILSSAAEWSLIFWSADFLETVGGLSKATASAGVSVYLAAMLTGRVLGSRISRRFESRDILPFAISIGLGGFLILWLIPVLPLRIIGLFIAGLGVANLFPLTLSLVLGLAPGRSGLASARVTLGTGLAIFSAPLLLGWLADHVSLSQGFGVIGAILSLGLVIICLLPKSKSSKPAGIT